MEEHTECFTVYYCTVHGNGFAIAGKDHTETNLLSADDCWNGRDEFCDYLEQTVTDETPQLPDFTTYGDGWENRYFVHEVFYPTGLRMDCPSWLKQLFSRT